MDKYTVRPFCFIRKCVPECFRPTFEWVIEEYERRYGKVKAGTTCDDDQEPDEAPEDLSPAGALDDNTVVDLASGEGNPPEENTDVLDFEDVLANSDLEARLNNLSS